MADFCRPGQIYSNFLLHGQGHMVYVTENLPWPTKNCHGLTLGHNNFL